MEMKRIEILVGYDLDGMTMAQASAYLLSLDQAHGAAGKLEWEDYDDGAVLRYVAEREETPNEVEARRRLEDLDAARLIDRELAEFRRLKAKFDGAGRNIEAAGKVAEKGCENG